MSAIRDETLALLSLFFAPGIGPVTQRRVLEKFGSALQAIRSASEWTRDKNLQDLSDLFNDSDFQSRLESEARALQKNQGKVISLLDPEYPPLLKMAFQTPPILFYRGSWKGWEDKIPLAFVGSRTPSDYGRKVTEMLIEGLEGLPIVIVSGFAKGIDTFAHDTALRVGPPPVGVLGTGVDAVYPPENKSLFEKLDEKGAFLSQFPTGTLPLAWNFPERNRVIAGASRATLVIEAREKSGALITAQFALEEGREVMAVPGNILSMKNKGCHRLIQQGARLVTGLEDILEELKMSRPQTANKIERQRLPVPLEPEEDLLFQKIAEEPLHIDKITEISNLPASSVAGVLTTLTLKGLIEELPGKFYVRS